MFSFFRRLRQLITGFIKRLFIDAPNNQYERIVFDALYAVGTQLRKGIAA